MAATLTSNLTGLQYGNISGETGMNLESHDIDFAPEYITPVLSFQGDYIGDAKGAVKSDIGYSGLMKGSTGFMAYTFFAAVTPTNSNDGFGQTTGGVYMKSASIKHTHNGFSKVDFKFDRYQGRA